MRREICTRIFLVIFLPISIVCDLTVKGIEESAWERQSDYKQKGDDCVSDFLLLQEQVFTNNSQNRFKILETFAPVNKDLPLAVFVTYHENSTSDENTPGVHFDQVDCAEVTVPVGDTVWLWVRSPVFLMVRPHILNWISLRTLSHFDNWRWSQIKLEIPKVCKSVRERYLGMLTKQVNLYAIGHGQYPSHTPTGYVMMGKSPEAFCGAVKPVNVNKHIDTVTLVDSIAISGNYLILLAVLSFTTAWMSQRFPKLAVESYEYTYQYYGMMWGIIMTSTIAVPFFIVYNIRAVVYYYHLPQGAVFASAPYHTVTLVILGGIEIPVAAFFSAKYKMAIPVSILRISSCLCKDRRAVRMVHFVVQTAAITMVLYAIQCISGNLLWIIIAFAANPYSVIVTTAMMTVIVFSSIHLFAVLAIIPHVHTKSHGLMRKIHITLLQVASIIFFIIVAGCIVCVIGITNKVVTTETDIFSNIKFLITPAMVIISFIIQNIANTYFTLQRVKKERKSLRKIVNVVAPNQVELEMSQPVTIDRGDVSLSQPLLLHQEEEGSVVHNRNGISAPPTDD